MHMTDSTQSSEFGNLPSKFYAEALGNKWPKKAEAQKLIVDVAKAVFRRQDEQYVRASEIAYDPLFKMPLDIRVVSRILGILCHPKPGILERINGGVKYRVVRKYESLVGK